MPSEGSRRWRGNEAGMTVISFQDVRKLCRGSVRNVCVCAYLLRQVGEDLCADPVQSLHDLSLRNERSLS